MVNKRQYFELLEKHEKLKAAYRKMNADFEEQKVKTNNARRHSENLSEKLRKMEDEHYEFLTGFDKLLTERDEFLDENEKLRSSVKSLKKGNYALKEFSGKEHSYWHLGPEMAWRRNPKIGEIEKYETPRRFEEYRVTGLGFDGDFNMCWFKHTIGKNRHGEDEYQRYKIPCSLYTLLGGIAFKNQVGRTYYDGFGRFNTKSDLVEHLSSKNEKITGKYADNIIQFILDHQETGFSFKEFEISCGFKNRESARLYLNKLIKLGLIRKVAKGEYRFVS